MDKENEKYLAGIEYLVGVVQLLSNSRTLEEVIAITRTAARKLTGADGATFILKDGSSCYYVDEDAIGPLWKGKKFPMTACISGWSMINKTTAVIEDIYQDERIPHDAYRPTFVKSLAMVPIRKDQPVGAIGNYWSKPYKASPTEVKLLETLANSTSLAIENVQHISDLEKVNKMLQASVTSKDEFLALVSHELRTPITALQLHLQLSERQSKGSVSTAHFVNTTKKSIDASLRQVNTLANRVDELLELSKIHLDNFELHYSDFSFSDVIENVIEKFKVQFNEVKCELSLNIDPNTRGSWDHPRINQVVRNLISNAIKFAPGKPIKVSALCDRNKLIFKVKDSGPGIPPEMQEKIFERYERANASSNDVSGLGLGLFLTKKIVNAHGGRLHLESAVGKGAKFTVELPMQRSI